jgi:uncharacterized protein (TIGR02099 family)
VFKKRIINDDSFTKVAASAIRLFWVFVIASLVISAIYVSLARHFLPLLTPNYKADIENRLSLALGAPVHVGDVSGVVVGVNPQVLLTNVQIGNQTIVESISVEIAVAKSILARQIRLADVKAVGIQAMLTQLDNGWQLGDVFLPSNPNQNFSWMSMLSGIHVNESEFNIILKNGKKFSINKLGLILNQSGKRQRIISNITLPNKKIATLIAEGKGSWADINKMKWDFYARLPDMDWLPWLADKTDEYVSVKAIEGSGEAWLQWHEGKINDVRVKLELPSFAWQYVSNQISDRVKAVQVELIYQQHEAKTVLAIPSLSFMREDTPIHLGGWALTKTQTEDKRDILLLEAPSLLLDSFVKMALTSQLLPTKTQTALAALNPRGELQHLKGAVFLNNNHELINFKMAGQLKNVSIAAWDGSPQVSGVDGDVLFNKEGGHFSLNSIQFAMNFPDLFSQGWQYRLAKGDLYWLYDDKKFIIRSGLLNLTNDVANVFGQFDFTSPHDVSEPDHLGLQLSFKDVNANNRMQYIPTKAIDKSLSDWLGRAIVKGNVTQGAYLYDGGVAQAVRGDETQQLSLDVQDVELKFDEAWPALEKISGTVVYNNQGLYFKSNEARFLKSDIKNINASLAANESIIRVNGQVNTSVQTAMEILRTTPLHQEIGSALDTWQAQGLVAADVRLGIALDNQATQADVRSMLKNTNLKIPDLNLTFNNVNGDLNYSSTLGLSSQQLNGTTFDMPINVSIVTSAKDPSLTARLRTQGKIEVDTLAAWQPSIVWPYIKGVLPYELELQIPMSNTKAGKKPMALIVNSSLQGTAIALPKPFGKTLKDTRALKSTTLFNVDNYRIDASMNNEDVRGVVVIGTKQEPLKANIYLGPISAVSDPKMPGLTVTGSTSTVNVNDWMTFIASEKKKSNSGNSAQLGINVDIMAAQLQAFDQSLANTKLSINRQDQAWRVGVNGEVISGELTLPDNLKNPYDVYLKYIHLPKSDTPAASGAVKTDLLATINPSELPAMQIKVDDFRMGEEQYGKWYFTVSPIKDGVNLKNIQLDNVKLFSIMGDQASWTQDKKQTQSQTYFKGTATTTNLNTALAAWGYETGIVSQQARFDVDMTWPGSPALFSATDSNGSIKFRFDNGRIMDVSGKTNALKIFGLMNLSALTRRLTGEFSDLYESGISYDKVQGNINIQDGIATFVNPMVINGPSSDFKITGTANLRSGQLNQEIIVTPPVGQNATLIATVLCGPACGGITYLIQKIAGSGIKQFTSLKYRMTGSFDNPKVDKETIFIEATPTPAAQ